MSTIVMNTSIAESSPRQQARIAGAFYVTNVVTSLMAFNGVGGPRFAFIVGLIATASYVAVTVLLYRLFKPVNRSLSLIAAVFSLAGCLPGILSPFHVKPYTIDSLAFFGFYCHLIGYLILRSTFLPRIFGVLMVFAGLGWLTFLSPSVAKSLLSLQLLPGRNRGNLVVSVAAPDGYK